MLVAARVEAPTAGMLCPAGMYTHIYIYIYVFVHVCIYMYV